MYYKGTEDARRNPPRIPFREIVRSPDASFKLCVFRHVRVMFDLTTSFMHESYISAVSLAEKIALGTKQTTWTKMRGGGGSSLYRLR